MAQCSITLPMSSQRERETGREKMERKVTYFSASKLLMKWQTLDARTEKKLIKSSNRIQIPSLTVSGFDTRHYLCWLLLSMSQVNGKNGHGICKYICFSWLLFLQDKPLLVGTSYVYWSWCHQIWSQIQNGYGPTTLSMIFRAGYPFFRNCMGCISLLFEV